MKDFKEIVAIHLICLLPIPLVNLRKHRWIQFLCLMINTHRKIVEELETNLMSLVIFITLNIYNI